MNKNYHLPLNLLPYYVEKYYEDWSTIAEVIKIKGAYFLSETWVNYLVTYLLRYLLCPALIGGDIKRCFCLTSVCQTERIGRGKLLLRCGVLGGARRFGVRRGRRGAGPSAYSLFT